MRKLNHLRQPLQSAKAAKNRLATHLNMWRFATHGERRFRGDSRYNLENVTNGFLPRIDDSDDTELLKRICEAYSKAVNQQQSEPDIYKAAARWQQIKQRSLGPVVQALLTQDIDALRAMYRNFYRDSCSAGLLGAPYGMAKAYFSGKIKDVHRKFYLSHVLYRFDYWMEQTDGLFPLSDLANPGIGNPFGVQIGKTHISVGSEYAHYCAYRLNGLRNSAPATIAEIGGGFGGMAYYLLRNQPNTKYLDFDRPEKVALTSYYLLKAFPKLNCLLYGEKELTKKTIDESDILLMPSFELSKMPSASVDITFGSHAMADIRDAALVEYLAHITRTTRNCFLYFGNKQASETVSDLIDQRYNSFQLEKTRTSGWHSYKVSGAGVGGAAALADSTTFEQCYKRTR